MEQEKQITFTISIPPDMEQDMAYYIMQQVMNFLKMNFPNLNVTKNMLN